MTRLPTLVSKQIQSKLLGAEVKESTYMTPNTPPGLNCEGVVSMPAQAAVLLASKKYVQ
jgi:hypothetical protein